MSFYCVCQELLQHPSVQEILDRLRIDEGGDALVAPSASPLSPAALLVAWWALLGYAFLLAHAPPPALTTEKRA